MTDRPHLRCGALILALLLFGAAQEARAQAVEPSPWCRVDDPAAFYVAREALVAAGRRDVDDTPSPVPCPERVTGTTLPINLTLPMPCGRAMVFRRVDVPVGTPLDQVEASFGRSVDPDVETPQTVLSNGPWSAPVAGVFSLDAEGRPIGTSRLSDLAARAYYVARYELMEPQWKMFELGLLDLDPVGTVEADTPACAPFTEWLSEQDQRRGVMPAGGLSWFDAVAMARAYGNWLIALDAAAVAGGSAPVLPWEQGATGYVRLPTEAEWEYAARAGAPYVTPQARSLRLPAMPGASDEPSEARLDDVCADAPRSGRLAPVGRNAPNLLGLHDVVCNADEIVLDLFRPTRPDGLGGQVGGVMTKGGSSFFLREENTVGRRAEAQALFTLEGEGTQPTMGTRLALSAPVFPASGEPGEVPEEAARNLPFETALLDGRRALLDSDIGLPAESSAELEAELRQLREAVADGQLDQAQMQGRVSELRVELDRLNVALRARTAESLRQQIRSAVVAAHLIDRVGANMLDALERVVGLRNQSLTEEQRDRFRNLLVAGLQKNEQRIQAAFDLYLSVHLTLAGADEAFVLQQIREARRGLSGASVETFAEDLERFEVHHRAVRASRNQVTESMRRDWISSIDTYRAKRGDPEYAGILD